MASMSSDSYNNKDYNCFKDRPHKCCPSVLILSVGKMRSKAKGFAQLKSVWTRPWISDSGLSGHCFPTCSKRSQSDGRSCTFPIVPALSGSLWCLSQGCLCRRVLKAVHPGRSTGHTEALPWSKGKGQFKCSRVYTPQTALSADFNDTSSSKIDKN